MTRNGIGHLDCWCTKRLPLFGAFVRFDFYPLGLLSYGAFLHCGFSLCAHVILIVHTCITWSHVRNGIGHLDFWDTKILNLLGVFVRFDFYPLGLLSYGAFVHFGFSLCTQVMLTVQTCCDRDHMNRNVIVHLDCWRTKILSLLGVLTSLIFILWGFCPGLLLSIGAFLCALTWCWLSTLVVIVITW